MVPDKNQTEISNENKDDEFVTLFSFTYPTEAYPFVDRLETEGIECFLFDENLVAVVPFLSNAVGGVKLRIRSSDLEKALRIVNELKKQNEKPERVIDEKWKSDYVPVETYCPECESPNVYRKKFPWYKIVISVIFAPYLLVIFLTKRHYCADCGHSWKE